MRSRNDFGTLVGNGLKSLNQNPLVSSVFSGSYHVIPVAPGSSQFISTEDGLIITTEDGIGLVTE